MRALVVAIVVALGLCAAPVDAGPVDDRTVEDRALAHLDRGVAAFRRGDYTLAHRELEAANRLAPDRANPYRWLALTEVQLGDCTRALVNIEGFLARVPADEPRAAEMIRLRVLCQRTLAAAPAGPAGPSAGGHDRPAATPITRRWWFWTAVIGAAATVGGVVVVVTREPDATALPPIACGPTGCRPGGP